MGKAGNRQSKKPFSVNFFKGLDRASWKNILKVGERLILKMLGKNIEKINILRTPFHLGWTYVISVALFGKIIR